MCTLTWVHAAQTKRSTDSSQETSLNRGYQIHFNRDESRKRSKALPPQRLKTDNVDFLAPIDQQAHGTWIFVNNWGFSACLLNNYIDIKGFNGSRSRGLLVKDLSHAKNIEEALQLIDKAGIENYSPFDIYLFDLEKVYTISWNGEKRVDNTNPEPFKSSSGFDPETVITSRKNYSRLNKQTGESLRDFHRSHLPDKSMLSVCMHRDDACTQSYTEISVNDSGNHREASIRYTDGPPCRAALSEPLSIALT